MKKKKDKYKIVKIKQGKKVLFMSSEAKTMERIYFDNKIVRDFYYMSKRMYDFYVRMKSRYDKIKIEETLATNATYEKVNHAMKVIWWLENRERRNKNRRRYKEKVISKKCAICGKNFVGLPIKKYCSKRCLLDAYNTPKKRMQSKMYYIEEQIRSRDSKNKNKPYTKDELAMIASLQNEGKTIKEIARILDRPYHGLKRKIERLQKAKENK